MATKNATKYGFFMESTYLRPGGEPGAESSQGEPGEEAAATDRDHGLNLKVTAGRSGKGNDATFGKFISLYEGDKYVDPLKARLQGEQQSRSKNVVDRAFKTAGHLPKHATPGDFYGTSGKVPYMPPFEDKSLKKGEVPQQPRGMYTSPAKKGSFGFNKLTISERVGAKGIATEYEYQHDPLSMQQQREKEEREKDRKARASELPFKPANPPKKGGFGVPNTTISKGKGVVGEWEYVMAPADPDNDKAAKGDKAEATTPFKPTNVFASQRIEHIEYIHDPEVPKLRAEAERKLAESKRLATTGAWKPTQSYKTDMVRSIVRMNLR